MSGYASFAACLVQVKQHGQHRPPSTVPWCVRIQVRSQYAVILALAGEHEQAEAEMCRLAA